VAEIYRNAARLVAGLPGVVGVREDAAEEIGRAAESNLSRHRESGDSSIVVTHDRLDSDVILDDPASLSIELGRGQFTRPDGVTIGAMEGLHILRDAI
jgi:hypothetical protein